MANPFKGGGGGGMGMPDIGKLMKLQKQMMEDAEKMQDKLEATHLDGTAGGVVKAMVNGHGQLLELTIAPEAVDPNDVEMLQDLIITAVREALEKAETLRTEEQKSSCPRIFRVCPAAFSKSTGGLSVQEVLFGRLTSCTDSPLTNLWHNMQSRSLGSSANSRSSRNRS
jgi:DNA-binding YbaB/EbfC family protein